MELLRPVISLKSGVEYTDGDGSVNNPYYVGTSYNITNTSNIFHIKKKSPPNKKIIIDSKNYAVTSFKLNGQLIEGYTFIMPNEDVTITDIEYIDANYTITNTDSSVTVQEIGKYRDTITLEKEGYSIKSFKMNNNLIMGDHFIMPCENVTITDIITVERPVVESEHNPYPNSLNNAIYYENTFQDATSITIDLTYQTHSLSYDWIYLYDNIESNTPINNKKYGGSSMTTETITINGNYLKITLTTNASSNNYYGFKAIIKPNYS